MSITLERYGKTGWYFTINGTNYRTNGHGDGLWCEMGNGARYGDGTLVLEYKQITGTCDFSLPESEAEALERLKQLFKHT